jgi:hypothetical protein
VAPLRPVWQGIDRGPAGPSGLIKDKLGVVSPSTPAAENTLASIAGIDEDLAEADVGS